MTLTDLISTAASSGTVGSTLTTDLTASTTPGYLVIGITTLLFIIGHLLDRKYSHPELE